MAENQVYKQAEKYLKALLAAIASMRKTGCYGKNNWAVNFEWPTAEDLLQMAKKNIAIKVRELKYKENTSHSSYFGGFQLILSNGTSSPVFTATGQDAQGL